LISRERLSANSSTSTSSSARFRNSSSLAADLIVIPQPISFASHDFMPREIQGLFLT